MPLINANNPHGERSFYTVRQLSQLALMGITNIKFGFLVATDVTEELGTHANSGVRPIGDAARVTRSIGLLTCASVIYITDANYYVHHANAGDENQGNYNDAIQTLGNPDPAGVRVIYAHPNAQDEEYQNSVNQIVTFGIPAGNVFEIANLEFGRFGINNQGRLGY